MTFTSKQKVVARLDESRQQAKNAALKLIETALRETKRFAVEVDLGQIKLHPTDRDAILNGYISAGWRVLFETRSTGHNETNEFVVLT
jgi:hypothetical protein